MKVVYGISKFKIFLIYRIRSTAMSMKFRKMALIGFLPARDSIQKLDSDARAIPFEWIADGNVDEISDSLWAGSLERLSNGVGMGAMRTERDRHSKSLGRLAEIIRSQFQAADRLRVCDLAVSTGINSVPFFDLLSDHRALTFHATDYSTTLRVVRTRGSRSRLLVNKDGQWLQAVCGRIMVVPSRRRRHNPFFNRQLARILELLNGWRDPAVISAAEELRVLSLAHPEVARKQSEDERFIYRDQDYMTLEKETFDVIRLMAYSFFVEDGEERRRVALRSIGNALQNQGLFIVGRGNDDCAVFRRQYDRFVLVEHVVGNLPLLDEITRIGLGEVGPPAAV